MKKLVSTLIFLFDLLLAKELKVCDGVQACNFPVSAAGVNAAIKASDCGDVIKIKAGSVINIASLFDTILVNKSCPKGMELVITTSQTADWLPDVNQRISPGYLPHLPLFDVTDFTSNYPIFRLDTPGTSGVIFLNIAVRMRAPQNLEPFSIFKVGPAIPTSIASLGTNVTLDRVYITGDFDPAKRVKNPVQVDGNISVLNSFFDDIHKQPNEEGYHVYISNSSIGPFRLVNNYFGGGVSIGSLTGGSPGLFFTEGKPHPRNYLVEHNAFYNSPRFYEGSANYVGDANRPCIKNIFELKQGSDAVIRWNSGENSFNGCGSQWFGFVFTVRNEANKQKGSASLSADRLTVTIRNYSGVFRPLRGQLLGISKRTAPNSPILPGYFEWRRIVSVGPGVDTYTVDAPYPTTLPNLASAEWGVVTIPDGQIQNIYAYGNIFRNVATGMLTLGRDDSGEGGILSDVTFKNNLIVNDSPLMFASPGRPTLPYGQSFSHSLAKILNAGENISIDNNTMIIKNTIHPSSRIPQLLILQDQGDSLLNNITKGLKIRNNIAPWGLYGIMSSGLGTNDTWNLRNDVGLEFRNNLLLGMPVGPAWQSLVEGCTAPRICKENQLETGSSEVEMRNWLVNPTDNEYTVRKEMLKTTGFDNSTVGVDVENIPLIRGLSIASGDKTLLFRWRVSQVLKSLPCSLELSTNSQLINDDGTFALVNALRPDYFKRSNYDVANKRASISMDGIGRNFQVGEDSLVIDDGGVQRNLALQPLTTYYYRLTCGGATERGSTTTKATIPPTGPPVIGTAPLPVGAQGISYSAILIATGGTGNYTWSASGLPAGLSIAPATGVISGTPSTAGIQSVAVTVTDSATPAVSTSKTLSLTIAAGGAPTANGSGLLFLSGARQTVRLVFSHPQGYQQLGIVNALINQYLDGQRACYIAYSQPSQVLYLVNDQGPGSGLSAGLKLGRSDSVGNSQCTIFSASSSATGSGNLLTLNLDIAFKSDFTGNKIIYLAAQSISNVSSGWQRMGVFAIPQPTVTYPLPVSMTPSIGREANQIVSYTFQDVTSANNLQTAWALINSAFDGRQACYVAYDAPGNTLYLYPDNGDGNAATKIVLTGTNTIQNSQCLISATGSSTVKNGNQLTLNLNVTFKSGFSGPRGIWTAVQTLGGAQTSAWKAVGAWLVP